MELEPYDKICRCCFAQGAYKDFHEKYNWMGAEEVYADILRECFEIKLTEEKEMSGICEVCITQLRNAYNFRKQVLSTEERFKQNLPSIIHGKCMKVEFEEVIHDDSDHAFEDDTATSYEYLDPETAPVTVKSETKPEQKKSKKKAAPSTPKKPPKRLKVETAETSTTRESKDNKQEARVFSLLPEHYELRDSKFCCKLCVKTFANRKLLHNHVKLQHFQLSGRVHCKLCPKKFLRIPQLKLHFQLDHPGEGMPFPCHACDKKYYTERMLSLHIKNYHMLEKENSGKKKKKNDQTGPTTGATEIDYHTCTQYEVIDSKYHCSLCNKICKTKKLVRYHIMQQHFATQGREGCKLCPKRFVHVPELQLHYQEEHPGEEAPYICNACKKGYYSARSLRLHIKCYHMMEKNFTCDICGAQYFDKVQYQKHLRNHSIRKYSCGECPRFFLTEALLDKHLKCHLVEKKYPCSLCEKKISKKKFIDEAYEDDA